MKNIDKVLVSVIAMLVFTLGIFVSANASLENDKEKVVNEFLVSKGYNPETYFNQFSTDKVAIDEMKEITFYLATSE